MMRKLCLALWLLPAGTPLPSRAQEAPDQPPRLRDLCSERPGLTTPACTVDAGHLQIEVGIADWEHDQVRGEANDQLTLGQTQLRYGIGSSTELQLSVPAFVRTVARSAATGTVERSNGIGDISAGLKQNFSRQDGSQKLAAGVVAYINLPSGTREAGAGDWGAGAVLPFNYRLNDKVQFALSPRMEAAVDQDRSGRHLAYGAAAGIELDLSDALSVSPECEVTWDRDPAGASTMVNVAMSITWAQNERSQLDLQGTAGLNAATPDVQLAVGFAHEF